MTTPRDESMTKLECQEMNRVKLMVAWEAILTRALAKDLVDLKTISREEHKANKVLVIFSMNSRKCLVEDLKDKKEEAREPNNKVKDKTYSLICRLILWMPSKVQQKQ